MIKNETSIVFLILVIGLFISQGAFALEYTEIKDSLPLKLYVGNILYVGGNGPNNYTRIQDAVDNSSDGDTVYVYSGFYDEYYPEKSCSVLIDKKINLVGEDKYTTIIDGGHNYDVVHISADDTVISGFTIQNSGTFAVNTGIDCSRNFIICGNIIKNNSRGIAQLGHGFSKIYNNIISDNRIGIHIYGSMVSIYGNIIENNEIGIGAESALRSIIRKNHLENNAIGLKLDESRVIIFKNNFINNTIQAKYINYINTPTGRDIFWNNYWDDWSLHRPRQIQGEWYYFSFILIEKFGPFPSIRFDWNPASEPYDV